MEPSIKLAILASAMILLSIGFVIGQRIDPASGKQVEPEPPPEIVTVDGVEHRVVFLIDKGKTYRCIRFWHSLVILPKDEQVKSPAP